VVAVKRRARAQFRNMATPVRVFDTIDVAGGLE
jgi:hypothetical protein